MRFRRWVLTRNSLLSGQLGRLDPDVGGFHVPDGWGGARRNYFSVRIGRPALTTFVLAGRQLGVAPVGALVPFPNNDAGTCVLTAWWAYSEFVRITRLQGGERQLVRGAAPKATGGLTRMNRAFNPRFALSVEGVTAGSNTTISHLTEGEFPPGTDAALRLTADTDGTVSAQLPVLTTAQGEALSLWVRTSPLLPALYPSESLYPAADLYPSHDVGVRLVVEWGDGAGVAMGSTSFPMTSQQLVQSDGTWNVRMFAQLEAPTGAQLGLVTLEADGMPAGGTVDVTGILLEDTTQLRPYLDGDQVGGNWLGDRHNSGSTLAPTVMIVDGEIPIGMDVVYEMTNPRLPGYRITTQPVRVESRKTFLTDPRDPENPFVVWVETEPDLEYPLEVAEFVVPNRVNVVTIAEERRHSSGGELTFITQGEADHERLMNVLMDPTPKLIRSPADHRHPPLWWMRMKNVSVTPFTHWSAFDLRRIPARFVTVDAPPVTRAA